MKRKFLSSALMASLMLGITTSQTSCRSTLYNAAERGDIETVRAELAKSDSIDSYSKGPQNIFLLPVGIIALSIDATNLALMIGTLGIYYHCIPTDRPFLLPRMMKNPIDAALDGGHYEIANLLAQRGDTPIYDKHYHGGQNTAQKRPATKKSARPVVQPQQTQAPVAQQKPAAPKQQQKPVAKPAPTPAPAPQQPAKKKAPRIQSAAGSVS